MIELKQNEYEVFSVMADLLAKGTPETRICLHFIREDWSPTQVLNFLRKLELSLEWERLIYERFMVMFKTPPAFWQDKPQNLAENLRRWVSKPKRHKKVAA